MSAPRLYTTNEAAAVTRHRPQTYRKDFCLKGHFHGIKPVKIPGGRLLWPADEIDRLVSGEATQHPKTATQHA